MTSLELESESFELADAGENRKANREVYKKSRSVA